jgi:hypothetical protein
MDTKLADFVAEAYRHRVKTFMEKWNALVYRRGIVQKMLPWMVGLLESLVSNFENCLISTTTPALQGLGKPLLEFEKNATSYLQATDRLPRDGEAMVIKLFAGQTTKEDFEFLDSEMNRALDYQSQFINNLVIAFSFRQAPNSRNLIPLLFAQNQSPNSLGAPVQLRKKTT